MNLARLFWSPRTLSFWAATVGIVGVTLKQRWAAHFLLAVGWGGAGGAYFRVALREGVAVQPLDVWPHLQREDWESILSHAVLIAPGVWALRRN